MGVGWLWGSQWSGHHGDDGGQGSQGIHGILEDHPFLGTEPLLALRPQPAHGAAAVDAGQGVIRAGITAGDADDTGVRQVRGVVGAEPLLDVGVAQT